MLYLLQALIFWLLVAGGLGLIVGALSGNASVDDENYGFRQSFFPFALLIAAGVTVAWLRWLPGRYGLWLETALLLLAAYLVGCALGCVFARGWFGGARTAQPASPTRAKAEAPPTAQQTAQAERTAAAEDLALAAASPAAFEPFDAAPEAEAAEPPQIFPPLAAISRPDRPEEDDLRLIQGVDEGAARRLRELGVRRFEQIAAWTPAQQPWIGLELGGVGPKALRFWIAQARLLAGGVETEFVRLTLKRESGLALKEALFDEAAAEKFLAALPEPIPPHAQDEIYAGLRPLALLLPPYGEQDDLCRIAGVDAATAQRLNALGVWTYGQIARWSEDNARWIGSYLAVPGRVGAENWIQQARDLALGCDVT